MVFMICIPIGTVVLILVTIFLRTRVCVKFHKALNHSWEVQREKAGFKAQDPKDLHVLGKMF